MRHQRSFTLVEIVISIFILLLLTLLAVPSLNGVLADKRLHRSLDRFNDLVRQAHERSLAEHRAYLIVWNDSFISLQPAAFLKTEEHQPIDTIPITRHDRWSLELPAALMKKVGGMGFLGIGSVRAGPHQVCQQRRQLDHGIFCVERTGRTNSLCASLEKIRRGAVEPALGRPRLY